MTFIPQTIRDKDKGESKFIKTDDLLKGVWQILGMEIIKANNPKFGAHEGDALLVNEVLAEGETIEYKFVDPEGNEKVYSSKGLSFYLAFKNADEDLNQNDRVTFKREGKGEETRWSVTKV